MRLLAGNLDGLEINSADQCIPLGDAINELFLFQPFGINSGLGLQHLQKMRRFNWEAIWHKTMENILLERNYLTETERVMFCIPG
ncbi:hypothetical protein FBUS_00981 [Fasciolopsis buskii]|uniref:Uncharacterized protein n=1 Tax=Fasciolopsis buskii TaxID=27845 RepID=A0A8E0VI28_9TREM|nr:hypothetical protein FBUS_00981 [Fasciolopsis buski]